MFINTFNTISNQLFTILRSLESQKFVGRVLVPVSLLSFVIHILLIAFGNCVDRSGIICHAVGTNYLSAIYTPFSIILFYEVFEMVIVLPRSVTRFMTKQYQVVSLIILRDVFKDVSHLGSISLSFDNITELNHIGMALGTSLTLFFLVAVFQYIHRWTKDIYTTKEHDFFISVKKMISVLLALTFIGLMIYSAVNWISGSINPSNITNLEFHLNFFTTFFMILIFVDIFLMIFSLTFTKDYNITFRNGAFIASTMMLRFSLSSSGGMSYLLAIGAVVVGIVTWLIYHFYIVASTRTIDNDT